MENQKELDRAAEVLSWNNRLMSLLGVWPSHPNDLIFSINFSYFGFLMILEYLDLFLYIDDLEQVVMNLTENMAFSQIFVRIFIMRLYNDQIGEILTEVEKDFDKTNYKTAEEIKSFITYNARSKMFMKLLMVFVALTASSYYLTPIIIILGSGSLPKIVISENVTQIIYLLPYRFYTFYAVENMRTYVITYALEMPFVFVSGVGQAASDCVMVTLVFHICGQMSVLALRINSVDADNELYDCRREVRHVVLMHIRLLRMGKRVEQIFSTTLLVHLIGATSLLCVLGYQILTNFAKGEKGVLVTFLIFQFLVLLILYVLCTVGESLLTESTKVCEAFYDCHWYSMSKNNAQMIILCMARSQKPLCLTAGKFTTICLSTLTDVLKTSMGYLSVLRSFLERLHGHNKGDHIEDLFVHLERIFSIGGIWPSKRTYVRFAIYISHYALYLVMAWINLYDVFGNLELMVMNIVETVAYSITFPLMCLIRCSNLLKLVINVIRKDMVRKFENSEEERIYYNYNYISKVFTYGSVVGMFITVVSLYFRPLVYLLTTNQALRHNDTEPLVLPYRVHPFLDTSNTHAYILMYLYLFPLIYISVCHMAAICLMVILVFHICGELSILSYRIKHVGEYSEDLIVGRIGSFVRMHLKIIWLMKSIDNTFHLILLDELLGNSIVLAISLYYIIMNLDVTNMATCFTFTFFAIIALVMLFGYCLMGDQLTQQCVNVQDAYYECNWYEMPPVCKKCLLICMIRSQVMLYLTAGRFYIFSFTSFTDIIRTSLAYLSMLRTLI
ncbi:uncharacterized protein LOC105199148 [Solenopsis invicta]|uniref:uncharacterized protein LOC105199148 n=1 Tax=Solenopsis invicta TaxID=13686 RepID=UPI00193DA358|nr:uncharacterized protein LOC105199148 [Solenopsis invicta]